jgi:hypothetical protein
MRMSLTEQLFVYMADLELEAGLSLEVFCLPHFWHMLKINFGSPITCT